MLEPRNKGWACIINLEALSHLWVCVHLKDGPINSQDQQIFDKSDGLTTSSALLETAGRQESSGSGIQRGAPLR